MICCLYPVYGNAISVLLFPTSLNIKRDEQDNNFVGVDLVDSQSISNLSPLTRFFICQSNVVPGALVSWLESQRCFLSPLCIYPSVYISVYIPLCIYSLFISLCIYLCVCTPLYIPLCIYPSVNISVYISLCMYPSVGGPASLVVCVRLLLAHAGRGFTSLINPLISSGWWRSLFCRARIHWGNVFWGTVSNTMIDNTWLR